MSGHTHIHIHTHTHTYTHDNYYNPPCACAPRVNKKPKFSYTESAGNVSQTSLGTSHVEVSGLARARRRRTFDVLNYGYN